MSAGRGGLRAAALVVAMLLPGSEGLGAAIEWRSFDGTGNNVANPDWGSAGSVLLRKGDVSAYPDGIGDTVVDRGNARAISNLLVDQRGRDLTNERGMSDFIWIWGQFLDHDIDLSDAGAGNGGLTVVVPDPANDPFGSTVFEVVRSDYVDGTAADGPRQQINSISAFIDGSQVYGSDETRAAALREFNGGRLKTSAGDLMPFNEAGLENANANPFLSSEQLFLAGDVRANEQIGLTAMHTLFVREHNRLADQLMTDPETASRAAAEGLSVDEYVYQSARRIVGAEIQMITYQEFLPALLGGAAPLAGDASYDANVNPGIANEFSTAFFRGHSLLSNELQLLDADGNLIDALSLAEAFFSPGILSNEPATLESLLRGFASQTAQEFDPFIVDGVRNFLFGPPGAGGLDLAVLNITQGRDHGLPDYNTLRELYGLERVTSFNQIACDSEVASLLAAAYGSVDNIDPWAGGLSECHIAGASVGELVATVLADQFTRLRDGDRFFYLNDPLLWESALGDVVDFGTLSLGRIVELNTGITGLAASVFFVPAPPAMPLMAAALLGFAVFRRRAGSRSQI